MVSALLMTVLRTPVPSESGMSTSSSSGRLGTSAQAANETAMSADAHRMSRLSEKRAVSRPDRHTLHQHYQHADIGQHQAGALSIQPQACGSIESEDALERGGRQPEDEADVNQWADAPGRLSASHSARALNAGRGRFAIAAAAVPWGLAATR